MKKFRTRLELLKFDCQYYIEEGTGFIRFMLFMEGSRGGAYLIAFLCWMALFVGVIVPVVALIR